MNAWHLVKKSDQERIRCEGNYGECQKPAVACEHSPCNTTASFSYYCLGCAIRRGYGFPFYRGGK